MSNSVDERVVNMQFNNKQFESGVSTSLDSIDKLKKSMDFKGASQSLSSLSDAGKKFSLAGIGEGIDTIASKFTTLGIIGVTALQNITNSAINAGKRIVSALTIDPITQGFSEYELKMNSVQTIMAGTGESLDNVMKKLNELNEYSDKTIYSFADMTQNIGKFTNAGVSLDQSVAAIQGIANVAAVSGANANEASRAMYNFAQALSAGYVKLIDWKSIENANMATVEFKTYLLDAAVAAGTLTKTTDGMYKTMAKGTVISATQNFNDSLQEQWMTTDVLVGTLNQYADETTEIGKKATAAASDIKTLSQMYDTLKESAGSGWATTWEIISGNYDESKLLYTELGKSIDLLISSSADARNEMLQMWKDDGGREALIQSFRNLAKVTGQIVTPIKEAFKDIFPPMTGKRLSELTKSFEAFTAKLKIGADTSEKIKKTFKGVFSVFSIGVQFLTALAKGAKTLVSILIPGANGLLSFSSAIGEFVSGIDSAVKSTNIFDKAFGILTTVITTTATTVSKSLSKITDAFGKLTGVDMTSFDTFMTTFQEKFHPLETLSTVVTKSFDALGKAFGFVGGILSKSGTKIGEAFNSMNFAGIIQLFTAGGMASIIIGVKKLIGSFNDIAENAGGFLKGITDILDGVRGCLEAYQNNLKATTMLKIAGAIAILAGSLLLMSFIDAGKLTGALTAITVLFTELFGSMAIFDKIAGSSGFKSMGKVTLSMVVLSTAILILASATAKLASVDTASLTGGLIGVAALISMMVGASKMLSGVSGNLIKASAGLVIFAVGIRLLTSSVSALGKMDTMSIVKGLAALMTVMSMLALFMMASKYSAFNAKDALGLVATAIAVRILASAIKSLGDMDPDAINAGLVAIGIVLTELGLFTELVGNGAGLAQTAAGLVVLGIAMKIFASAVEDFGTMDLLTMMKGLLGLSLALAAVTLAVNFMPKNMVSIGLGMVAMSTGLLIMANAIQTIGGMPIGDLAKGLIALGIALAILVVSLNAMNGTLAGSAALLVASGALMGLAVVLRILGSMGIGAIVKSLVTLAMVFVILGGAAAILSPLIPAMMLLGAALIVLGVGLAAIGAASLVLGAGLAALSVSGLMGVVVLLAITAAIIPLTLLSPAVLIVSAALVVFSVAVLALGVAMSALGAGLAVIVALGQPGLDALTALTTTAAGLSEFAIQLIAAGAGLLVFGAGAIVAGAGALVAGLGFISFAAGMRAMTDVDLSNLADFGSFAVDMIGVGAALLLATPGLLAGGAALSAFGSGAASTGAGLTKIQNGIKAVVVDVSAVPGIIEAAMQAITSGINGTINSILATMTSRQNEISSRAKATASSSVSAINSQRGAFQSAGANLVDGFVVGIYSRRSAAISAAANVAAASLRAAKAELDINSPSGEFEDVGMYSDYGLAKGLLKYSHVAVKAAESVGEGIVSPVVNMSDNMLTGTRLIGQGLRKVADDASNISPTISSEKTVVMKHEFDTLHVEGVNDEGEFVAAADYSVEDMLTSLMRRQNRT